MRRASLGKAFASYMRLSLGCPLRSSNTEKEFPDADTQAHTSFLFITPFQWHGQEWRALAEDLERS